MFVFAVGLVPGGEEFRVLEEFLEIDEVVGAGEEAFAGVFGLAVEAVGGELGGDPLGVAVEKFASECWGES